MTDTSERAQSTGDMARRDKPQRGIITDGIPDAMPFLPDLCSVYSILFLLLLGELLALVLVLAGSGLYPFDWTRLGLVSLSIQWIVLPSAAVLCQLRPRLARMQPRHAGIVAYLVVLAVIAVVLLLQVRWMGHLDLGQAAGDFLVGAICAGIVLRYAYLQQQLANQQRAEMDSRWQALQSRIRPHFLFNSMNSLASLIALDPPRAERMVLDLSALFRASLAEPRLVPVQQELALARRYLDIEALRLGARLKTDWLIGDFPAEACMPSMLLQPLLENAIVHGVARCRQGGEIVIALHTSGTGNGTRLCLSVTNPLPESPSPSEGNGMATENIRLRLAALYGRHFVFEARPEAGHFNMRLEIPLAGQAVEAARGEPRIGKKEQTV